MQVFPYFYVLIEDARAAVADPQAYAKALEDALEAQLRGPSAGNNANSNPNAGGASSSAAAAAPAGPGLASMATAGCAAANNNRQPPKAIRSVIMVRGIPYYGFHYAGPGMDDSVRGVDHGPGHVFAKIVLYNPSVLKRAAEVLQGGLVMNTPFQPYEAHLPFLLQFVIDYNLCGMALLATSDVKFRLPLPSRRRRPPIPTLTMHRRVGFKRTGDVSLGYDDDGDGDNAGVAAGASASSSSSSSNFLPSSSQGSFSVLSRVWLSSNTPAELCHDPAIPQGSSHVGANGLSSGFAGIGRGAAGLPSNQPAQAGLAAAVAEAFRAADAARSGNMIDAAFRQPVAEQQDHVAALFASLGAKSGLAAALAAAKSGAGLGSGSASAGVGNAAGAAQLTGAASAPSSRMSLLQQAERNLIAGTDAQSSGTTSADGVATAASGAAGGADDLVNSQRSAMGSPAGSNYDVVVESAGAVGGGAGVPPQPLGPGAAGAAASSPSAAAGAAAAAAGAPPQLHAPSWLAPDQYGIWRPNDSHGYTRDGSGTVSKESTCELEVDIWVEDILNPLERAAMRSQAVAASARAAALRRKRRKSAKGAGGGAAAHLDVEEQEEEEELKLPSVDGAVPFSSVFSLAYLWEEEKQRRAALGLAPQPPPPPPLDVTQRTDVSIETSLRGSTQAPQSAVRSTGPSAIESQVAAASPGAAAGSSSSSAAAAVDAAAPGSASKGAGYTSIDVTRLSASNSSTAGSAMINLDLMMEKQLARIVAADEGHLRKLEANPPARTPLAAAVAVLPPASDLTYGVDSVRLKPTINRYAQARLLQERQAREALQVVIPAHVAAVATTRANVSVRRAAPSSSRAEARPSPASLANASSSIHNDTQSSSPLAAELDWLAGQYAVIGTPSMSASQHRGVDDGNTSRAMGGAGQHVDPGAVVVPAAPSYSEYEYAPPSLTPSSAERPPRTTASAQPARPADANPNQQEAGEDGGEDFSLSATQPVSLDVATSPAAGAVQAAEHDVQRSDTNVQAARSHPAVDPLRPRAHAAAHNDADVGGLDASFSRRGSASSAGSSDSDKSSASDGCSSNSSDGSALAEEEEEAEEEEDVKTGVAAEAAASSGTAAKRSRVSFAPMSSSHVDFNSPSQASAPSLPVALQHSARSSSLRKRVPSGDMSLPSPLSLVQLARQTQLQQRSASEGKSGSRLRRARSVGAPPMDVGTGSDHWLHAATQAIAPRSTSTRKTSKSGRGSIRKARRDWDDIAASQLMDAPAHDEDQDDDADDADVGVDGASDRRSDADAAAHNQLLISASGRSRRSRNLDAKGASPSDSEFDQWLRLSQAGSDRAENNIGAARVPQSERGAGSANEKGSDRVSYSHRVSFAEDGADDAYARIEYMVPTGRSPAPSAGEGGDDGGSAGVLPDPGNHRTTSGASRLGDHAGTELAPSQTSTQPDENLKKFKFKALTPTRKSPGSASRLHLVGSGSRILDSTDRPSIYDDDVTDEAKDNTTDGADAGDDIQMAQVYADNSRVQAALEAEAAAPRQQVDLGDGQLRHQEDVVVDFDVDYLQLTQGHAAARLDRRTYSTDVPVGAASQVDGRSDGLDVDMLAESSPRSAMPVSPAFVGFNNVGAASSMSPAGINATGIALPSPVIPQMMSMLTSPAAAGMAAAAAAVGGAGGAASPTIAASEPAAGTTSSSSSQWHRTTWLPPSAADLKSTFHHYGLPEVTPNDPHYGNDDDVPDRPKVFAGMIFRVPGTGLNHLQTFDTTGSIMLRYKRLAAEQAAGLNHNQPAITRGGAGSAVRSAAGASSSGASVVIASQSSSLSAMIVEELHPAGTDISGVGLAGAGNGGGGIAPSTFAITSAGLHADGAGAAAAGAGAGATSAAGYSSATPGKALPSTRHGSLGLGGGDENDDDQDDDLLDTGDDDVLGAAAALPNFAVSHPLFSQRQSASQNMSAANVNRSGVSANGSGRQRIRDAIDNARPPYAIARSLHVFADAARKGLHPPRRRFEAELASSGAAAAPSSLPLLPPRSVQAPGPNSGVNASADESSDLIHSTAISIRSTSPEVVAPTAQRSSGDSGSLGIPVHALIPEVLPPTLSSFATTSSPRAIADADGAANTGPWAARRAPQFKPPAVLLRRFIADQRTFFDLSGQEQELCARAGHVTVIAGAARGAGGAASPTTAAASADIAPRLKCTRTLAVWGQPMPTRAAVDRWLVKHPPQIQLPASTTWKAGQKQDGVGMAQKQTKKKTKEVAMPVFEGTTGRLIPGGLRQGGVGHGTGAGVGINDSAMDFDDESSGLMSSALSVSQHQPPAGAAAGKATLAAVGSKRKPPQNSSVSASFADPIVKHPRKASTDALLSSPAASQPQPKASQAPASSGIPPATQSAGASAAPINQDLNQHLTTISVEVHAASRGHLLPDPRVDSVLAICYSISDDDIIDAKRKQAAAEGKEFDFSAALVTGCIHVDAAVSSASTSPFDGRPAANAVNVVAGMHGVGAAALPMAGLGSSSPAEPGSAGPAAHLYDGPATDRLGSQALGLGSRMLVTVVPDEASLLWAFVGLVRDWDVDVVCGYELQMGSIGYLLDRAQELRLPLATALSRTPMAPPDRRMGTDEYGEAHDSGIWLPGRIILNIWRLMRGEMKLGIYTFENVIWNALHVRVPHFPAAMLTRWWNGESANGAPPAAASSSSAAAAAAASSNGVQHVGHPALLTRWRVLEYFASRAALNLHVIDSLDLMGRTSEMARLFGIDFFSVLSRGSQYRVEAMMIRVSKPLGYLAPSASRNQVARQAAMECIPLIMEPQSRIYTSPMIVLDFQSLYPSIIIAYNMCYSTCLGRLSATSDDVNPKLGVMQYTPPQGSMADMYAGAGMATSVRQQRAYQYVGGAAGTGSAGSASQPFAGLQPSQASMAGQPPRRPKRPTSLFFSPNGTVFAPWTARQGILPRMLREILDTRVMVKNAMKGKEVKSDPVLMRVMHARQFALKMIANVTYGYTAAGFSGRMPCAEIADAIVQTARSTLERAVRLVEAHPTWRARVVYGDTDSLFVVVPGRSEADAFKIGEEIASEVTARNPRPITLKLEKVYHPAVLVAKKRYAGFMYESASQAEPTLDCKGLEMVRRDQCGLVSRMMDASIKTMFKTMDLSALKTYLVRQWISMFEGRAPVSDYIFAKEVRLGTYSTRGPQPPAAVVASKAMIADRQAEPRYGERVPFVVIQADPNARLVDTVITPHQLLRNSGMYRLNNTYYVTKCIIPSLDRIFSLVGADIKTWFTDMKRPAARRLRTLPPPGETDENAGAARAGYHPVFNADNAAAAFGRGASDEPVVIDLASSPDDKQSSQVDVDGGAALGAFRAGASSNAAKASSSASAVGAAAAPAPSRTAVMPARGASRGAGSSVAWAGRGGSFAARPGGAHRPPAPRTIDAYYSHVHCELCGEAAKHTLCDTCTADPQRSGFVLLQRRTHAQKQLSHMLEICQSCTGIRDASATGAPACDSLDCPVLYERFRLSDEVNSIAEVLKDVGLDD